MSSSKAAMQVEKRVSRDRIPESVQERATEPVDEKPNDEPGGAGTLHRTVNGLSAAFKELETQLRRQIRINEVLQAELSSVRKRVTALTAERQRLSEEVSRMEKATSMALERVAQLELLSRERQSLVGRVDELNRFLEASRQRIDETVGLLDRMRTERDSATGEVMCLESQLSRALTVIGELKARLDEERDRGSKPANRQPKGKG